MQHRFFIFLALTCSCAQAARASSTLPLSLEAHVGASAAVFRGTALEEQSYRDPSDGLIYTRTLLRVEEGLKGVFPPVVKVVHRGGQWANEHDIDGFSPQFRDGEEYLLFVSRRGDGTLFCTQGRPGAVKLQRVNATIAQSQGTYAPSQQTLLERVRALTSQNRLPGDDVTDQSGELSGDVEAAAKDGPGSAKAVTGLLVDANGISARFLQPDRGEPIPYLIDADSLPAGITLSQATNAVLQALNAWAAVTSLKFKFEGIQSFGVGADAVASNDERLRIQLHDNYNRINTANVLGIGGRSGLSSLLAGIGWDIGGNVAGNEFRKTGRGYVVLESTNPSMEVPATFTEVLCHEIGHALSMAHSSEDPNEADNNLRQAIMFFQAHADGRGAALGTYDPPIIRQAHPFNPPPFTFGRVMDITSAPSTPSVPGINEIELRGYDLQNDPLTFALTNISAMNGSFSLAGNLLRYAPAGFFPDVPRFDPAGNSFYDRLAMRMSDGTNASPYIRVRVVSFNEDNFPSPASDGMPDTWMSAYFGNANPAAGPNRGANDDFDGDGLMNKEEYIADGIVTAVNPAGDPTDSNSAQRILLLSGGSLQFQAKPYELYEVLGSANLATWSRVATPFVPTNETATVSTLPITNAQQFFRILKVP